MTQNYNSDKHFQSQSNMQPFQTSNFQDRGPPFSPDSSRTFQHQHSIQNIPHKNQVDVCTNMQRNFANSNYSCNQDPNSFRFPSQAPQMSPYNVSNPNSHLRNQSPQMNSGSNAQMNITPPNVNSFPLQNQNPQMNSGPNAQMNIRPPNANSFPLQNQNPQMNIKPNANYFPLPNPNSQNNVFGPNPNSFPLPNQNPQINIGQNPNSFPLQNPNPQINIGQNPNYFPLQNQNPQMNIGQNPNYFSLQNQNPQMNIGQNLNSFPSQNPNPKMTIGTNLNSSTLQNQNPQINIGPNANDFLPFQKQHSQAMTPVGVWPFMDNSSRFINPPIQRFNAPPVHSSSNYWNQTQNLTAKAGDSSNRQNFQTVDFKVSKPNTPEADQEWLREWSTKVQERLKSEKKRRRPPKFKINEIQKKLLRYATLVRDLESSLNNLPSNDSADDEEFACFRENAEASKKEIIELGNYFNDDQNLRMIKRMIARRRRKRLVARKARKEKAALRREIKEEWKEKEKRIDEKLEQLREQEKDKLNEKKIKKEADAVLREVRMKQDEAKRMQQILQALTKLREARIKKGEIHGYVASPQANIFFDNLNSGFDRLLKDQLSIYNIEEQTLRVMMEESKSVYPHLKKTSQAKPKPGEVQKHIYEALFGKKDDQNDLQNSFTAADESIEVLVQRRSDWDNFLTSDDNTNGSAVPIPWVLPNESPQEDWKCFQKS